MMPAFLARDEYGELHAIQTAVADALRDRGVITERDGEWRISRYVATHLDTLFPELAVCDFCSERPIVWTAACDDFTTAFGARSVSTWCACETCGELVRTKQSRALLERQVAHYGEAQREILRRNLRLFWSHYAGTVVRIAN